MKYTHLIVALISGLIVSGCATQAINSSSSFQPAAISSGYQQKTDHFLVIVDSSSSMGETYLGSDFSGANKLGVEKILLSNMNQTIPSSLNLTSGIRTYGFGKCLSGYTEMKSGMETYSSSAFDSGINTLTCSSGGTPMFHAFAEAPADLADTTGQIAVIVLSDGQVDATPIPQVQALKAQYGERLCIYSVWVGNPDDVGGHNMMRQISDAGGCGFVTQASSIASSAGMADFVTRVFMKPVDLCQDNDVDGVCANIDQCPTTPKGATVNTVGCWIIKDIRFDTDKSDIKAKYHSRLNEAVTVIKNNSDLHVKVQGHTDNTASAKYNLGLSDRRADAVVDYFVSHGISANRLKGEGYGLTQPIDTNSTPEGRYNNRRVQLKPSRH